jgi:hypothetical protein
VGNKDGDVKMSKGRKKGLSQEFTGPLWDSGRGADTEVSTLEEYLKESCKRPNGLHEDWLHSLLAEGVSLENALEMLVGETPN